ncbi:uncharacterized protein LOC114929964 isoform X2 [Nylanderia fulva]|uniref:uncharacterized protein LOC114929964 isoform X2 n=1 Tax=Nylanderia fulva TaxID=613905 RepID=UPI0010FB5CA5|nr:uncharacterized protein LOC114929964 isoform X2 [Nylanderia fulva]
MPAEINRGGHWVLHCDSRADRPTATPIHVTIFAKLPRFDKNRGPRSQESRGGRVLKDWRRKIEIQVKAPSDSSARVPKIGDKEDRILGSATDRNSSTQPPRRRRREDRSVCFASRKSEEIEDARERLPIAWNSQESEEKERVESRLRDDETEQSCLAIADSIARRRSLQDRSQTRRDSSNLDTSRTTFDYPGRTRITEDRSLLLSSHRSRTRFSTERSLKDNLQKDVERSLDEELDNRDSRRRVDDDDDDEGVRSVKERTGRIGQDRRRIGNGRVRSFLQLVLLLFLVAFGQRGLGSSSVIKLSARPTASILGIGAIIGAVSAGSIDLAGDASTRAERSANLSHITGASRKIQMYIKNRHLQILPDGTVNGSNDDTSDYTIFQRTSVSRGQLRIQGVATCLYLCMDSCGLLYGSREYTEDCVFNETLEQHNYNTYSSIRWSTAKRTMYLGLNRFGQPRKVLAKGHNLGRLSGYARVLTQMAPFDRVEALHRRMLGAAHNVRHRHHERGHHRVHPGDVAQQSICPTMPEQEKDGRDRFRCRKRKKRKKRRRRCRPGEQPGPQCRVAEGSDVDASSEAGNVSLESKRSCEGAASEEACRRQALSVPAKKRKSRIDDDDDGGNLTLNNDEEEGSVFAEAVRVCHGQGLFAANGAYQRGFDSHIVLVAVSSWCVNRSLLRPKAEFAAIWS